MNITCFVGNQASLVFLITCWPWTHWPQCIYTVQGILVITRDRDNQGSTYPIAWQPRASKIVLQLGNLSLGNFILAKFSSKLYVFCLENANLLCAGCVKIEMEILCANDHNNIEVIWLKINFDIC